MSGFVKHDTGKPRISLVPPEAIIAAAEVMGHGADKYDEDPDDPNWAKCDDPKRYYDAAMRHLLLHRMGERDDPEDGCSHLSHAMVDLMFMVALEARNTKAREGM